MLTLNQLKKTLEIAESFYGTSSDPEQIPINIDSFKRLISIHGDTLKIKADASGNPISWVVVVPTSTETMDLFLDKEINEKELFDRAVEEKKFESLYLCSAFTMPEHRGKGYAKELLLETINQFAPTEDATLYAWIYSKEGENLIKTLKDVLGREIKTRKDV